MVNAKVVEAVRLLGVYSAGRFDIWALAGPAKRRCRQHVLSVLVNGPDGKNIPQNKCGVNAIRTAFYDHAKPEGNCPAAREKSFVEWCRNLQIEQERQESENARHRKIMAMTDHELAS